MNFLKRSYRGGQKIYGTQKSINDAIRSLKKIVAGHEVTSAERQRFPVMIEMVLSYHARKLARERTGHEHAVVEKEDMAGAALVAANLLQPVGNRPTAHNLHFHVRALMALIHETFGEPVLVGKTRNSVDDPHFKDGISQIVPKTFAELDPKVTVVQLVNAVQKAQKAFKVERLAFVDILPGYTARVSPEGDLVMPGYRVEEFNLNIPTYYPKPG